MSDINHILKIDASARHNGSISRQLSGKVVDHFAELGGVQVVERDLKVALPFVTEDWIGANFTKANERSDAQIEVLSFSDRLVNELEQADTVGRTFRYTENGPEGLLNGKRAIILVASGGTKVGSDIDFATPYLRHALKFIGITDVTFIAQALETIKNLN